MSATRRKWTRDEVLVALNLYHKLNFGQLHSRNPAIIALAKKLDRGANSLAMKLSNFASLDPVLKLRGIQGLQGASSLDRETWQEFHSNINEVAPASEAALRRLFNAKEDYELQIAPQRGFVLRKRPPDQTEIIATVKQRRGQEFFRESVLNNFGRRCGITQLSIAELLVASHILPWSQYPEHRLNVQNGLCLSRLHDAAFDCYLISFDENLRLLVSPHLAKELKQRAIAENFLAFVGEPLHLPSDAAIPDPAFLAKHRSRFARKA